MLVKRLHGKDKCALGRIVRIHAAGTVEVQWPSGRTDTVSARSIRPAHQDELAEYME